jgi:hypothetical protein
MRWGIMRTFILVDFVGEKNRWSFDSLRRASVSQDDRFVVRDLASLQNYWFVHEQRLCAVPTGLRNELMEFLFPTLPPQETKTVSWGPR